MRQALFITIGLVLFVVAGLWGTRPAQTQPSAHLVLTSDINNTLKTFPHLRGTQLTEHFQNEPDGRQSTRDLATLRQAIIPLL